MGKFNQSKKRDDFEAQQQYVENLSHELLTPLTVIRTEAELLLQSENIAEHDLKHIDKIIETVNRLAKINKGLILLSKIHKGIYIDREEVDVYNLAERILSNFENQIELKKIHVEIQKKEVVFVETNKTLMEILITNALKNAINHNIFEGNIKIVFSKSRIEITNTGRVGTKDPKELFNRFVSDRESINSVGLGLSIMQRISEDLNYTLEYSSKGKIHIITLTF
ncbi:MAG: signal transduction histidine kinase [Crocinitomicaceae bacterium]|jgi:signal transduction histidine kinase